MNYVACIFHVKNIIPSAANEGVCASSTIQCIISSITSDFVGLTISDDFIVAGTQDNDIFVVGKLGKIDASRDLNLIRATICQLYQCVFDRNGAVGINSGINFVGIVA